MEDSTDSVPYCVATGDIEQVLSLLFCRINVYQDFSAKILWYFAFSFFWSSTDYRLLFDFSFSHFFQLSYALYLVSVHFCYVFLS